MENNLADHKPLPLFTKIIYGAGDSHTYGTIWRHTPLKLYYHRLVLSTHKGKAHPDPQAPPS